MSQNTRENRKRPHVRMELRMNPENSSLGMFSIGKPLMFPPPTSQESESENSDEEYMSSSDSECESGSRLAWRVKEALSSGRQIEFSVGHVKFAADKGVLYNLSAQQSIDLTSYLITEIDILPTQVVVYTQDNRFVL